MNQNLPKSARLCDDRLIEQLFQKGKKIQRGALVFKYLSADDFQVGFGVPKKRYPRAVDRNLVKRKLRESFRLHYKKILGEDFKGFGYFVFNGDISTSFSEIEKTMTDLLRLWKKV